MVHIPIQISDSLPVGSQYILTPRTVRVRLQYSNPSDASNPRNASNPNHPSNPSNSSSNPKRLLSKESRTPKPNRHSSVLVVRRP